jgi:ubiquinone/menaquinone biosynthesis C-methylase UbiE
MRKQVPRWQQSSQIFHERAKEYDLWFEDSLLFDIEKEGIQSLNITFSPPAFEIGVGPGRFALALGIHFGLDPAFASLLLAKKRGVATCQAIAEELPLATSSVGALYLLFTLCFIESPSRFFEECRRVLRPEAPLIIGFVPAESVWGQTLRLKKEGGHPFYKTAQFYTIAKIQQLLSIYDFEICKGVSTLYQMPGKVVELEQARAGFDEKAGFVVLAAKPATR